MSKMWEIMEETKNHWKIKGYCYWNSELSVDKNGNTWVNVGYITPMKVEKSIQKTLALSAITHLWWFN